MSRLTNPQPTSRRPLRPKQTTDILMTQAAEESAAEAQKKFMQVVGAGVKNALAGSENAVAL